MNKLTLTSASDMDAAELAKLNEKNALTGVDEGADTQPVEEHRTVKRSTTKED